jgi:hypothetical protein
LIIQKPFEGAKSKIERAYVHIRDLNDSLNAFAQNRFYTARIERDIYGVNYLVIEFTRYFRDDAGAVVGDAIHNLRSALDIMWVDTIRVCRGKPTQYTRFPIFPRWEKVKAKVDEALKQKRITKTVHDLVFDVIHPNQTPNRILASLGQLNDLDKHMLLIPIHPMMMIGGFDMEDQNGLPFMPGFFWLFDDSGRSRLQKTDGDVKLKNQGKPSATILFALHFADPNAEIPCRGAAVIPTLNGIAEEVSRTFEAFKALLFG